MGITPESRHRPTPKGHAQEASLFDGLNSEAASLEDTAGFASARVPATRTLRAEGQLALFDPIDAVTIPADLAGLKSTTGAALLNTDRLQYHQGQVLASTLYHERSGNMCFIARTGSGKTYVMLQIAAQHLSKKELVVIVSPTHVVVQQHLLAARKLLTLPEEQILTLTGEQSADRRVWLLDKADPRLIIGTPSTLLRDLKSGAIDSTKIKAVLLDEVHEILKTSNIRSPAKEDPSPTGLNNTDYQALVQFLRDNSFRLVGFTASPGRRDPRQEAALSRALHTSACIRIPSSENKKVYVHELAKPIPLVSEALVLLEDELRRSATRYYQQHMHVARLLTKLRERLGDVQDEIHQRNETVSTASIKTAIHELSHQAALHRTFFLRACSRGKGEQREFTIPFAGDYKAIEKNCDQLLNRCNTLIVTLERAQRHSDDKDPALKPIVALRGAVARAFSELCGLGHLRHARERLDLFGPFSFLDFTTTTLLKVKKVRSQDDSLLLPEPKRWEQRAYSRSSALSTVHQRLAAGTPYAHVHEIQDWDALIQHCGAGADFGHTTKRPPKNPVEPYLDHCARWMALHCAWDHHTLAKSRDWLFSEKFPGIRLYRCFSVREARFVKAVLRTHYRHRKDFVVEAVFGGAKKDEASRDDIMARAHAGKVNVLVATSILDLGVNVPALAIVFDFEIIADPVRRVQLAGRAGRRQTVDESDNPVGMFVTYFTSEAAQAKLRAGMAGQRGLEQRERQFVWREMTPPEDFTRQPRDSPLPQ